MKQQIFALYEIKMSYIHDCLQVTTEWLVIIYIFATSQTEVYIVGIFDLVGHELQLHYKQ